MRTIKLEADLSTALENKRHLRAGGHTIPDRLLVFGCHINTFELAETGLIQRKQRGFNSVALGMPNAL